MQKTFGSDPLLHFGALLSHALRSEHLVIAAISFSPRETLIHIRTPNLYNPLQFSLKSVIFSMQYCMT